MKLFMSRIVVFIGLLSCIATVNATETSLEARIKQGEAIFNRGMMTKGVPPCLGCHGVKGESAVALFPNLTGMPHEYTMDQIENFRIKAGKTKANRMSPKGTPTAMTPIVMNITKEDAKNVALYLESLKMSEAKKAKAKLSYDTATLELGRQIYRAGIPEKRVPACASCHGARGNGIAGQFPRLAGQHPEYIQAQLEGFLNGHRVNAPMMQDIVDRMSPREIKAVADYAAGLR